MQIENLSHVATWMINIHVTTLLKNKESRNSILGDPFPWNWSPGEPFKKKEGWKQPSSFKRALKRSWNMALREVKWHHFEKESNFRAHGRGYPNTRHCQNFSSDTRHWGQSRSNAIFDLAQKNLNAVLLRAVLALFIFFSACYSTECTGTISIFILQRCAWVLSGALHDITFHVTKG